MDTFVRVTVNVTSYNGDVAMVTMTPPGYAVCPLNDATAADEWNDRCRALASQSHRAARQWTIRRLGIAPDVLAGVWEPQKRGGDDWLLHRHIALGVRTAKLRRAAHVYSLALEREWMRRGGGFLDGGGKAWRARGLIGSRNPKHAGYYIAKYLVKRGDDGKPQVTENVKHRSAPPQVAYVSRSLTSKTGVTMRFLRYRRLAYVLGFNPITGEVTDRPSPARPEGAAPLDRVAQGP